jgi:hypothetical protein
VSFQDVDLATGFPDGIADEYAVVTAGLTADTWVDVGATGYMGAGGTGSGTKRSVTQGDYLAVVIEYASFNAGDSLNVKAVAFVQRWGGNAYPLLYTTSWAKNNTTLCTVSLKYDDGSYPFHAELFPLSSLSSTVYNSGSAVDEIALKFKFPFPCRLGGLLFFGILSSGDASLVLYDSDGSTVLASVSMDKDAGLTSEKIYSVPIPPQILTKDTFYYIALKPLGTSNIQLNWFAVAAAAILNHIELGQNAYWSQRVDGGGWADTITKRPWIGGSITALDDGAGGAGGLLVHPGMAGGMRG